MFADIQESLLVVLWPFLQWAAVGSLALGILLSIYETWAILMKALTRWF